MVWSLLLGDRLQPWYCCWLYQNWSNMRQGPKSNIYGVCQGYFLTHLWAHCTVGFGHGLTLNEVCISNQLWSHYALSCCPLCKCDYTERKAVCDKLLCGSGAQDRCKGEETEGPFGRLNLLTSLTVTLHCTLTPNPTTTTTTTTISETPLQFTSSAASISIHQAVKKMGGGG